MDGSVFISPVIALATLAMLTAIFAIEIMWLTRC
jgi:hypothetical protein